ncbi:MAG: hypothetical protein ABH864_01285 [archaeon]
MPSAQRKPGDEEQRPNLRIVRQGDSREVAPKEVKGRKEVVKLDKDYAAVAGRVLNSVEGDESRQYVGNVLGTEDAQTMYHDMRKAGMSNGQATIYLKHALGDLGQGHGISFKAYARAVAEDIAKTGDYVEALDAMRDDGLISEADHRKYVVKLKDRAVDRQAGVSGMLEKVVEKDAAVWLFMAIGAVLILVSGFTMTGAVVGSTFDISSLFVVGLVLFVGGIILKFRK